LLALVAAPVLIDIHMNSLESARAYLLVFVEIINVFILITVIFSILHPE